MQLPLSELYLECQLPEDTAARKWSMYNCVVGTFYVDSILRTTRCVSHEEAFQGPHRIHSSQTHTS